MLWPVAVDAEITGMVMSVNRHYQRCRAGETEEELRRVIQGRPIDQKPGRSEAQSIRIGRS
jgi:hypothetical protein